MNKNKIYSNSFMNVVFKWLGFMSLLLLFSMNMNAQDKKIISGTVNDLSGNPLIGVTILEDGTANGTTTDFEGNFKLQATTGNTITISYVGFLSKTINIEQNTAMPLQVNLEEDLYSLEEVEIVSIGYGTMRKSDLTGAISSVNSDGFVPGAVSSTEEVLQGKIAGLTIVKGTGDPSVGSTIRLRGGTSLTASNNPLVVVDGVAGVDINTVQPSDIKSVDVLKDASATAIYGSRGANGVIIITTKGEKGGKSVSFSSLSGVSYSANHMDILSANQWRKHVRDNNITDAVDYGGNTDWQEELEQQSLTQSYILSLSSGSEYSGIRASLSYLDKEGLIKKTGLTRLSANISGYQYALDKKIKFEVGLFANRDKSHPMDYRIFERAYNLNPTIPVKDANGNFTQVGGTLYENPVEILTNRFSDDYRNRILGYFKTEFQIIEGLKGTLNLSLENNAHNYNYYVPSYAVMEGQSEEGYGRKTDDQYTTQQLEFYLNYDKTWDKHNFSAMAGYSYLENAYEGFGAQRSGFVTDLFLYNNLAAGEDYRIGDVYSYKGKSNLVSFFARANYSYDNRFMFTATIRQDGSSRFGKDEKWGTFPSASAAWKISNEEFMSGTKDWLNSLKIRVGYGVTGNQDGIGEYKSLSILGVGNDSYYDPATDKWKQAYSPVQNPNPDLKWESTAQFNAGIDFGFINKIFGTIEFYNKKTSDLLYTYEVPQPPYLVGNMLANVGELTNKGVELTLNTNIVEKQDFTWSANLTMAHNTSEIESLSNQIYETDVISTGSLHGLSGMSNQYSQIIKAGYPVGTFWGYESDGLDENGEFILGTEKTDIGDIQSTLNLGFGMNFKYRNFDLGVSTYGYFGQKVLNATEMMLSDPNRLPSYNVTDSFLTSGIESPATYSSYWIQDASFFRIQAVTLGYTLPSKVFSNARIYLLAENLAVFTNYSGADPEIDMSGLDNPGIDRFNNYPKPRTISFGLNIALDK